MYDDTADLLFGILMHHTTRRLPGVVESVDSVCHQPRARVATSKQNQQDRIVIRFHQSCVDKAVDRKFGEGPYDFLVAGIGSSSTTTLVVCMAKIKALCGFSDLVPEM